MIEFEEKHITTTTTLKDFIEKMKNEYLVIGSLYPYWGFLLIGEGIEFLGACLDDGEFNTVGVAEERFIRAMSLPKLSNYVEKFKDKSLIEKYANFIMKRVALFKEVCKEEKGKETYIRKE